MSLTTRHTSLIIGLAERLGDGGKHLVGEEPNLTNEGWDSLSQIYTVRAATLTAESLAALFPIGAQLGTRKWWLTGAKPTERAPGFWTVAADYKGWAATKPAVIRVGAAANQQTASNVLAPTGVGAGMATFEKLETNQNQPTITVSYLVADITASTGGTPVSLTSKVSTRLTPPVTIDVPDNVWGSLTPFLYHWPNGWILMSSAQDRLPGTLAAAVTDTYQYVQAVSPG
jgi:hypothetical protein